MSSSNIEIKPTGSFFKLDKEGFLINPSSQRKIQEEWKPLINDIVTWYKDTFGDSLANVYIRGSVAKGEAISGVSDIDTFAYITSKDFSNDSLKKQKKVFIKKLIQKHALATGVELETIPVEESTTREDMIFLNQSLCVYGKPIPVRKMKPNKEVIFHVYDIEKDIQWVKEFLKKENADTDIRNSCVWIMKRILRTGCELVVERSHKYTRDLYPCYEIFSKYYPEKSEDMKKVLFLALNPTTQKEEIEKVLHVFEGWLEEQVKNVK